jgi:hypothetical protein
MDLDSKAMGASLRKRGGEELLPNRATPARCGVPTIDRMEATLFGGQVFAATRPCLVAAVVAVSNVSKSLAFEGVEPRIQKTQRGFANREARSVQAGYNPGEDRRRCGGAISDSRVACTRIAQRI